MANVYIEPKPPGGGAIDHYVIEQAGGTSIDGKKYPTQEEAIKAAKAAGHNPLIAHVRTTDKGKPDQWRSA